MHKRHRVVHIQHHDTALNLRPKRIEQNKATNINKQHQHQVININNIAPLFPKRLPLPRRPTPKTAWLPFI